MTAICKLNITAVRNIGSSSFAPSKTLNVFHGENGSGKTSVLEAIQTLATGRSFRASKLDPIIELGAPELAVYAELVGGRKVAYSKSPKRPATVLIDGDKAKSWEMVARSLPTLVIDASTFQLVDGGPKIRRSYLDWGVFHVEPSFIGSWRSLMRTLTHRNHLLKQRSVRSEELAAWSTEFCVCSTEVDSHRKAYLEKLQPYFLRVLTALIPAMGESLKLVYQRGWDASLDLRAALDASFDNDKKYGATQFGPHRAEISIKNDGVKAADLLSRGQSKLLVIALKIAQGQMLADTSGRQCVYLVDDLAAELDSRNRAAVIELLVEQEAQLFLTAVNKEDLMSVIDSSLIPATFHVERGIISP